MTERLDPYELFVEDDWTSEEDAARPQRDAAGTPGAGYAPELAERDRR